MNSVSASASVAITAASMNKYSLRNEFWLLFALTLACTLAHLLSSRQLKQFIWKWIQTLYRIEFRYVNCILSCIRYVRINRPEMSRLHISYESNGTEQTIASKNPNFIFQKCAQIKLHFILNGISVAIYTLYTLSSYANRICICIQSILFWALFPSA